MTPRAAARAALAAAAATLPLAARAQERPLGPMVRALAALPAADRAQLAGDSVASRMVAVTRDADGVPVAHVVVRLKSADPAPLLRVGARLGSRVGTLFNARVPLESLQSLLGDGAVAAVYGARRWEPVNDLGTAAIGVTSLRRLVAPHLFAGSIGRGVIVGLVDTGVDFTHPDFFADSAGHTRILYVWDQTIGGSGPGVVGDATFDYGTECVQQSLTLAGCPSRDSVGHGTHVLGTAAGDGGAAGGAILAGQFAGVAPGADLIVVKTSFYSDEVVDGVNYVFSRAAQLGRPAVVNLSLGSQWGPHDGTLPEELLLDSLEGPGRIVVAAAGNFGDNRNTFPVQFSPRRHAMAALSPAGSPAAFALSVPAYTPTPGAYNDFFTLQLWYGASDTVTVTVTRPDGSSLTSPATSSGPLSVTQDGPQGQIYIQNGPGSSVALTGDNLAYIALGDFGGGTDPQAGTWTISVTSLAAHSGRAAHLWLGDGTIAGVTLTGGTNAYLVGAPATATRVLAVGAYTTRLTWRDATGVTYGYPNAERLGDLAVFSSPGPRRDGVVKPDFAAPGKGIVSALSQFASPQAGRMMSDGRHWVLEGTSMAAPFATGSVALLLERDPRLTPEGARALLTAAARTDSFTAVSFDGGTGGTPNASWGHGKLSVPGAVNALTAALLGPGGGINFSENPVRGSSVVIHYDGAAARVGIYAFGGALLREFTMPPAGRLQWDLTTADGRAVVNGVYIVVVDLGSSVVRRRLYVARRSGP